MNTDNSKEGDSASVCANCGKEGNSVNNMCNKCNMVKYCNAACKKKHRSKHKKECEEHVRLAAEKHDVELFKQPPPQFEDCPICFLRMPSLRTGYKYQTCCGKRICNGCIHAPLYDNQGNIVDNKKCAFCRTPAPYTEKEAIERREKKRMEANDPIAIFNLGVYHRDGRYGYPQDYNKALELWHRAAELGHTEAYCCIGYAYLQGRGGVEIDKNKAIHYYELAAMKGNVNARYNLGLQEAKSGNMDRALKHFMIAARSGDADSVEAIQEMYTDAHATKEDYTKALQLYQEYLGEIKSKQRDEAAAANDDYRYY